MQSPHDCHRYLSRSYKRQDLRIVRIAHKTGETKTHCASILDCIIPPRHLVPSPPSSVGPNLGHVSERWGHVLQVFLSVCLPHRMAVYSSTFGVITASDRLTPSCSSFTSMEGCCQVDMHARGAQVERLLAHGSIKLSGSPHVCHIVQVLPGT